MNTLKNNTQLEYILKLQSLLQDYDYGVLKNGRIQGMRSAEEWNRYYRYMSPVDFERYHGGACWDYVAYQTEKLTKEGIKFYNYYLEFVDDPDRGTHTITVCELGNMYVYMESSFKAIGGVYISKSLTHILDFVLTEMYRIKKETFSKKHIIRRYKHMMKYGIDCEGFMNYMYTCDVVRDANTFMEKGIGPDIVKKNTEIYYRVTYNGIGIYEAFRQSVPQHVWLRFLKSDKASWLPKPPDYTSGYESYFTKLGFSKFEEMTLPYMSKFLDRKKINIKEYMDIGDIVYRDMFQVIVSTSYSESTNQPKYYFVSMINMNDELLQPRIPDNFLTQVGAEDNKTPRVCFSDSIDGCLIALSRNLKGMKLFVHVADCDESVLRQFRHPTTEEVPDADITDEVWSLKPVEIKCIGQIQVKKAYPKPLPYKYTDSDGTQKTAELYSWDWEWIYRFDEDSTYNESEHKSEPLSNFKTRKCDKDTYHMILKSHMKDKPITESYIINEKDIYYNKDKFDSGEINLCFITGHSGSGKSTMGNTMANDRVEHYDLDDVIANKIHFTMSNLKQYGDLIYSFFSGSGKKYFYTSDDVKSGKVKEIEGFYEKQLIDDFITYAMMYAASDKSKKFVLEGIWLYEFVEPSRLKNYAVYIKGTSALISTIRAASRDSKEEYPDKKDRIKRFKSWWGRFKVLFCGGVGSKDNAFAIERKIKKYRTYFSKLEKNKAVTESKKCDDGYNRKFKLSSLKKVKITKQLCDKLSKNYPRVKHLRINSNTNGFFFMKNFENLVLTIMVETKNNDEKWIQALEVEPEFRKHNLGNQLLDFAVNQMGARFLSVRKTNKIAISLYKKHGFKTYDETDSMYFMKLDKK